METIKNYLENMFMNMKKTPEVEKAKAELLSMMEDKYQELKAEGKTENEAIGIVISEFGNLDELAQELGIEQDVTERNETASVHVSLEEAKQYCKDHAKAGVWYAVATMLCVLSPVLLIFMGGLQEEREIADSIVVIAGLIPLFLLIAVAVVIFIVTGYSMGKYEKYEKEVLLLDYETKQFLESQREAEKMQHALQIAFGVFLCIVSVIPMFVVGSLNLESDMPSVLMLMIMLVILSVAIFFFVLSGTKADTYHVLLQEEEYAKDRKEKGNPVHIFDSIYWPIVVLIYLAWSFVTMDWHITWIIWPIAGVLNGAIEAIIRAICSK